MDWSERPGGASESWPADELRLYRPGSVVAVKLAGGNTLAGVLAGVSADALELDGDEGPLEIDVRSVAAYAVVQPA